MNFVVIYIGKDARTNLQFGLKHNVWGFKNHAANNVKNYDVSDTYIAIAEGYDGGSPRVQPDEWLKHTLAHIYVAKITSSVKKDATPLWPDEAGLPESERYVWRLSFGEVKTYDNVAIADLYKGDDPQTLAEGFRLSAINQSGGYLIKNIPQFLNNGEKIAMPQQKSEFEVDTFISDLIKSGLQFAPEFITRFVSSLLTKQFVILTGLTGSGKTKLAEAFSHWIVQNVNKQICMVAVGADWNSRDALLGYPNALKPEEYVKPDNGVLDLLINAQNDQTHPYFLILDEMNMSYVERYFADFLSAMESASKKISLHADWGECDIPAEISLPKNLFIIGTVNIDETTYMFSPKVLDRANVIEFRIAKDAMSAYLANPAHVDIQKLNSNGNLSAESFVDMASQEYMADESYTDVLNNFFKSLADIGAEFGYRTAYEMMRFMAIYKTLDKNAKEDDVLDAAIMQKMLPKVHGSRNRIEPALKKLASLCLNTETADPFADSAEETAKYKLSYDKIKRMHEKLLSEGFTSYAEA